MFTKIVDSCSYEPVEKGVLCVYFSQEMVLITLLICWDNPSKVGHYGGQKQCILPKYSHILILRTCEYAVFRDLNGRLSCVIWWVWYSHSGSCSGKREARGSEKRGWKERLCDEICCWFWRRRKESMSRQMAAVSWKRNWILPEPPEGEQSWRWLPSSKTLLDLRPLELRAG